MPFEQDYQKGWESRLDTAEENEFKPFFKFFKREHNRGIDTYLQTGKVANWDVLFNTTEISALYAVLYRDIGTVFSKYYVNSFTEQYAPLINPNDYRNIWRDSFETAGKKIAEFRGASVSETQQKELTKIIQRFHRSPEFQNLNEREAGRILRSQVKGLSEWRSKTIVRTEATNAANFASMQTAKDMYGEENLQKKWLTSFVNSRDAHVRVNGQKRKFKDMFNVGGEYLMHPGSGSRPENNINCKCVVLTTPV
jgi:hypothetical protein